MGYGHLLVFWSTGCDEIRRRFSMMNKPNSNLAYPFVLAMDFRECDWWLG
jgi:hypothetical protein